MKYILCGFTFIIIISCKRDVKIKHAPDNTPRIEYYANGKVSNSYEKKDGMLHGKYCAYYENGKPWAEGNYDNGSLNGAFITYSINSEIAVKENYSFGRLVDRTVYWQPINAEGKEFIFVSKEGFITMKDGKVVILDSNTPDNIIESKFENGKQTWYIWKKGKPELYEKDWY
jgi:antitoxin component YwqK of YwqJK toxin-antitoxin module